MWQQVNRAVGPAAVALHIPFICFLERAQQKHSASQLSRYTALRYSQLISQQPRFFLSISETVMSVAAIYDSVVMSLPQASPLSSSPSRDLATSIVKSTAFHEEAMLLEEPLSSEDETRSEEEALSDSVPTSTSSTSPNWTNAIEETTVAGATLPVCTTLVVNDTPVALYRNGHGIRTVRAPFGYNFQIYVATLYTQHPIRTEQDVEDLLAQGNGFVMEFTFLRDVTPSQMSIAWNYQLDTSVTENEYEEYPQDRETFLDLLDGSMAEGGTLRFNFEPDRIVLTNQGQSVGEINGTNFQRAFASMWFGNQPVMDEIKVGLLKGGDVKEMST